MAITEEIRHRYSDRTSFRKAITSLGTLNHRVTVDIASEGEIRRIREPTKFTCFKGLLVSEWTFFVFDELAPPVLPPPHIFGILVIWHIPTRVLEESKSNCGDGHVVGNLGRHKIKAHKRSFPMVHGRACTTGDF